MGIFSFPTRGLIFQVWGTKEAELHPPMISAPAPALALSWCWMQQISCLWWVSLISVTTGDLLSNATLSLVPAACSGCISPLINYILCHKEPSPSQWQPSSPVRWRSKGFHLFWWLLFFSVIFPPPANPDSFVNLLVLLVQSHPRGLDSEVDWALRSWLLGP